MTHDRKRIERRIVEIEKEIARLKEKIQINIHDREYKESLERQEIILNTLERLLEE